MGSQPPLRGGTSQPSSQNRGPGTCRQLAGLMWGVQGWPRPRRVRSGLTFSVSSFFTDLRLARRSMDTLCLEPSRARSMASAETRTRRRGGRLNFPRRSSTLSFRSLICGEGAAQGSGPQPGPTSPGSRPGPRGRPDPLSVTLQTATSVLSYSIDTGVSGTPRGNSVSRGGHGGHAGKRQKCHSEALFAVGRATSSYSRF